MHEHFPFYGISRTCSTEIQTRTPQSHDHTLHSTQALLGSVGVGEGGGSLHLCLNGLLTTPDRDHIRADPNLVGPGGHEMLDLLEIAAEESIVVLALDTMWGSTSLRRTEQRVLKTSGIQSVDGSLVKYERERILPYKVSNARGDEFGHTLSPVFTADRVHCDQELREREPLAIIKTRISSSLYANPQHSRTRARRLHGSQCQGQ